MEIILLSVLLINLKLLASSRLVSFIRWVAVQGVLLGLLAIVTHTGSTPLAVWGIALTAMILKGLIFPRLMFRALRDVSIRREADPHVGTTASLLMGLVLLGLSFLLSTKLPLPTATQSPLILPVAFFSILAGLFLIVSHRLAITQVLGYLVMENGIYVFGVGMVLHSPLLVELGVLLDLFVAVFVMGIVIFRIQRDFSHMDTQLMRSLKD